MPKSGGLLEGGIDMRLQTKLYLIALSFLLGGMTSKAVGQSPTFATIDYPGATTTSAYAVNSRGDIAGSYTAANVLHGFLFSASQFTTIDFPGAASTEVYAINTRGDLGGVYVISGVTHGFLLTGGKFTTIDFPSSTTTEVNAISPQGDIAGDYVLAGVRHGFLMSGGQYTTIDFPPAATTVPLGINPQGDIAGGENTGGVNHGFLLSEGEFTIFDFPGSTFTTAAGINARGDITGRYVLAGVSHGYLLSGSQFSTFDFPGATFTGPAAINARGDVVGRYRRADGVTHGFLMTSYQAGCLAPPPRILAAAEGLAIAHSADFTLVTDSKPASGGEALSLFAAGLGATRPAVAPGQPFPANPLAVVSSNVEVRVNGKPADLLGAVGFPGSVDGYQVNFRVQAGVAGGLHDLVVRANAVDSPAVRVVQAFLRSSRIRPRRRRESGDATHSPSVAFRGSAEPLGRARP